MVVEFVGCIFLGDLGLWDDEIENVLCGVVEDIWVWLLICLGIQLGYVGCKVFCVVFWQGGYQLVFNDGGWQIVVFFVVVFYDGDCVFVELSYVDLVCIKVVFVVSVLCVQWLGFELIELYVVYGYLLYQFFLLFSNQCCDEYGGLLEN